MKIFEMFGDILVNDKASKVMSKVGGLATNIGGTLTKGVATAAKWGAGISAGAVAAGGAMLALTNKVAASTDRIDKLSQRLGLSRESFQRWEFILSQSGSSMESLQSGMKSMVQRIADLKEGTGEGTKAFNALGISFKDIQDLKQEEVFEVLVKRFNEMEDGVEKAALAQDIFSRSGQELLPLLNQNAGAVDELSKKAEDLGLILDDKTIDAGVVFTDTMDQVKRSLKALSIGFTQNIMPVFQDFLELIIQNMPKIRRVSDTVFKGITKIVQVGAKAFSEFFKLINDNKNLFIDFGINTLKVIKSLIDGFNNLLKGNNETFNTIKKVTLDVLSVLMKGINIAWKFISDIWEDNSDSIVNIVTKSWKLISGIFENNIKFIKMLWELFGPAIKEIIKKQFEIMKTSIKAGIQIIEKVIDVFAAAFKGDWKAVWEGIKDITNIAINALVDIYRTIWSLIKVPLISFGNSIKEWFIELKDKMIQAGSDIIEGLVQGMKDKVGDAVNAVKGVGDKVIDGFKNLLGIRSPSRLFKKFGINIGEGLEQGIKSKEDDAEKAGENLGDATADGFKRSEKNILDVASENVENAIDALEDLKKPAKEVGEDIGEATAEGTKEGFEEESPNIIKSIKNTFGDIKTNLDGLIKKFNTSWTEIGQLASAIGNQMGEEWGETIDGIVAATGIAAKAMSGDWVGAATDFINQGPQILQSWWKTLGLIEDGHKFSAEFTVKTWENAIRKIDDSISGFAGNVGKNLEDSIGRFITQFEKEVDNVRGTVGKLLGNFGKWLFGSRKEVEDNIAAIIKSFNNLSQNLTNALINVTENTSGSFNIMVQSISTSIDVLGQFVSKNAETVKAEYTDAWDSVLETTDSVVKELESLLNEVTTVAIDEANELGNAVVTALQNQYDEAERIYLEGIDGEISALEQAKNDKKKIYEEDFFNKIAAIDAEAAARIRTLQEEVDAIDETTKKEEEARKEAAEKKKLLDLEEAFNNAKNAEDRLKAAQNLNEELAKRERERTEEERELRKAELNAEIDELFEVTLQGLQEERDATVSHYETLREEQALQAEAIRLATKTDQDELLELLNGYNPKWQDIGISFGERLLNGLNSTKTGIQSAVDTILKQVTKAQQAAAELLTFRQDVALQEELVEQSRTQTTQPAATPETQGGIIQQSITINSPTALNAAEVARQTKNASQQLALG